MSYGEVIKNMKKCSQIAELYADGENSPTVDDVDLTAIWLVLHSRLRPKPMDIKVWRRKTSNTINEVSKPTKISTSENDHSNVCLPSKGQDDEEIIASKESLAVKTSEEEHEGMASPGEARSSHTDRQTAMTRWVPDHHIWRVWMA